MGIEKFSNELNLIANQDIRSVVTKVLDQKVPEFFYEIPASKTGNYINKITGKSINLYERTLASVKLWDIARSNPTTQSIYLPDDLDVITAALILHDTNMWGVGMSPTEYPQFYHPVKFAAEMMPEGLTEKEMDYYYQIATAISTHHGVWRTPKNGGEPMPKIESLVQYQVHLYDYISSRNNVSVL